MTLTIKQLKQMLENCPDEAKIKYDEKQRIVYFEGEGENPLQVEIFDLDLLEWT